MVNGLKGLFIEVDVLVFKDFIGFIVGERIVVVGNVRLIYIVLDVWELE